MNSYIDRKVIGQIKQWLDYNKIVILYGARQVGKTTLARYLLSGADASDSAVRGSSEPTGFIACDRGNVADVFASKDPVKIRAFLGEGNFFVLDEAQIISDIGTILKVFHDAYPDIKLIATGSSSFELANRVMEPLTGRAKEITLLPFAWSEAEKPLRYHRNRQLALERFLRFGGYPEVLLAESDQKAIAILETIAASYLYKDIFMHEQIRKPELLTKLLKLLARQLGSEVSYNELATTLEVNRATVIRYIELLEKTFVIFRLPGLERNRRNEVGTRKTKIYFYDVGIRNAIIQSYGPLDNRVDTGALWENFCIVERMKEVSFTGGRRGHYFWRTQAGHEIDHVEEFNDRFTYFEYKWGTKKDNKRSRALFEASYPGATGLVINPTNFENLLKVG